MNAGQLASRHRRVARTEWYRVVGGAAWQDQVQRRMPKLFLIHGFTIAFRIVYMHLHILDLYPAGTNYSSDFPSSLIVSWTMTDANLGVRKMSRALQGMCLLLCTRTVSFLWMNFIS